MGEHADGDDNDHLCDYCQGAVEGEVCVDTDENHKCDECGETTSTCVDADPKDHVCDYEGCKAAMGEHADSAEDNDHACDYCGAVMGGHTYDKDGWCDCGDRLLTINTVGNIQHEVSGNIVTVNSAWACRVAYWDAETQRYVTLSGTMIDEDSYSFAAPDGVTELVVVVIGDMDQDGDLDATDNQKLAAALLAGDNLEENDLMMLVMDVNGNGKINSADRTLIARALLESTHDAYKPFAWETISQSEVA